MVTESKESVNKALVNCSQYIKAIQTVIKSHCQRAVRARGPRSAQENGGNFPSESPVNLALISVFDLNWSEWWEADKKNRKEVTWGELRLCPYTVIYSLRNTGYGNTQQHSTSQREVL